MANEPKSKKDAYDVLQIVVTLVAAAICVGVILTDTAVIGLLSGLLKNIRL